MPQVSNIPDLPIPDFLIIDKKLISKERKSRMVKHEDAYEAYCRWSALPAELRNPSTQVAFEKKWRLSPGYCYDFFQHKNDFQAKRLKNFWNWMFDKFPDVVYGIYKRALRNSASDAKVFVDIIGKKLETDQPKTQLTPIILMGVPQEKIDKLFVPKEYEELADKTTHAFKKDGERVEGEIIEEKINPVPPEEGSLFEQL